MAGRYCDCLHRSLHGLKWAPENRSRDAHFVQQAGSRHAIICLSNAAATAEAMQLIINRSSKAPGSRWRRRWSLSDRRRPSRLMRFAKVIVRALPRRPNELAASVDNQIPGYERERGRAVAVICVYNANWNYCRRDLWRRAASFARCGEIA